MADAVADTHALIWYLENSPRLGAQASLVFDDCDQGNALIYVPTICLVEIIYLQEKGRIPSSLKSRFDSELQSGTTGLIVIGLTSDIVDALATIPRNIVPDMPDRIVAATALYLGLPLLTKDRAIQKTNLNTVW